MSCRAPGRPVGSRSAVRVGSAITGTFTCGTRPRSGRPRTRVARLGTPTDLTVGAATGARWHDTWVRRYGRTDTVQITERVCLWYGSLRSRTVRVILVHDKPGPAMRHQGASVAAVAVSAGATWDVSPSASSA